LLEEQLAAPIEDQHVDRPVPQLLPVDLAPRKLADHLVLLIDDIKNLFAHPRSLEGECRGRQSVIRQA
jgi:hypothetical protein